MSFLKAPKKVINILVRIQRNFLWGGCPERKRIAWVKWERVCLAKNEGGLGVKNLEWFNKALLGKWRWRILNGEDSLWVRVMESRYGSIDVSNILIEVYRDRNKMSSWWKNICLNGVSDSSVDWFKESLVRRIGRGG